MKKIKTVAIIGRFKFPAGEAASTRVLTVGKVLKNLGYKVVFIGKSLNPSNDSSIKGTHEGFDYYNIVNGTIFLDRFKQTLLSGVLSMRILKKENIQPEIVIYYGTSSTYLLPFLRYRKKYTFKFITDIVEWYDASHVAGGRYGPLSLDVNYTIKKLIPKSDGVIAISSFLKNYYDKLDVPTVRIPILIDQKNTKWSFDKTAAFDSSRLNLVYAGVPGKKDLMNILIEAIDILVDEGHDIVFHMYGPYENQIKIILGDKSHLVEKLKENLKIYGRVNQNEIPQNLAKADFSVLIRPDKRYAHAGFPTKFVESLASGVPVIANLTSDLNLYLKDGQNGFIIEGYDVKAVLKTLRRALELNEEQKQQMKLEAKKEAITSFDYLQYSAAVNDFLESLY